MKTILIKWGIPSIAATILGGMWLVGTTEFKDNKTFLAYWHDHAMQPTPYQLASNRVNDRKLNTTKLVQGYEYLLDKHIEKIDSDLDDYCNTHTPQQCSLRQLKWEGERIKQQKKLDDMRKLYQESQADTEILLAGKIPTL